MEKNMSSDSSIVVYGESDFNDSSFHCCSFVSSDCFLYASLELMDTQKR